MIGEKTYYYTDRRLEIRAIRWFRLKVIGVIAGSVVILLALLLTANFLYNNYLGIGTSRVAVLEQENQLLRGQLAKMTDHMQAIESALAKINNQGNEFRLLVDLPPLDEDTRAAGTGGTAPDPEFPAVSDSSMQFLTHASSLIQQISGEMRVQDQSYKEILKKYGDNKDYFAAIPAIKPMDGYYSLKDFGMRIHPILGILRMHEGLDIIADVGTPVSASGDGVVQMTGRSEGGLGVVVVIRHGYGYQSIYGHLSKVLVREGQHVKRGDLIAMSGRSGLVSGPHLHYEVRYNGVSQNPIDFFFDDITVQEYRHQISSR